MITCTEIKDSDQVGSYFYYANAKFLLLSLPPLSAGHGRHQSNDHPGTEVNTGPSQPIWVVSSYNSITPAPTCSLLFLR